MTSLLCAIMIGTRCMAWHQKGTKPFVESSILDPDSISKNEIMAYGAESENGLGSLRPYWTGSCRWREVATVIARRTGQRVEWSCTRVEVEAGKKAAERAHLSPMESSIGVRL
jgi:hypothetical protein